MTTLPSFVELMATLGLENSADVSDERIRHSRSSSYSSTSSFISQSDSASEPPSSPFIIVSSDPASDLDQERRRFRPRFSPYNSLISHVRRVSLPEVVKEEEPESQAPISRALSTSPQSMSRSVARRSSALSLTTNRRPEKLSLDPDFVANTPISTFLRRNTPQSSPISPTFPHRRKRSSSPPLPVSIPTLPTFCFPPQPSVLSGCVSSDTDDDVMSDASSTHLDVDHRRKPRARKLVKGRSYPQRRPRSGEDSYRHRLAPLA